MRSNVKRATKTCAESRLACRSWFRLTSRYDTICISFRGTVLEVVMVQVPQLNRMSVREIRVTAKALSTRIATQEWRVSRRALVSKDSTKRGRRQVDGTESARTLTLFYSLSDLIAPDLDLCQRGLSLLGSLVWIIERIETFDGGTCLPLMWVSVSRPGVHELAWPLHICSVSEQFPPSREGQHDQHAPDERSFQSPLEEL